MTDEWLTSATNTSVVEDEDIRDDLSACGRAVDGNVVSSEDLDDQVTPRAQTLRKSEESVFMTFSLTMAHSNTSARAALLLLE